VTVKIKVSLKVNSYSTDEDAMEAVFTEAEQTALESINVESPCIVAEQEITDIECRNSSYCVVDAAA
jgi:hypothetical protein